MTRILDHISEEERADDIVYELHHGKRDPFLTLQGQLERLDEDLLDWVAWVVVSEVCRESPEYGEYVAPYRDRMNEWMPERILNVAKRHTLARHFVYEAGVVSTAHLGEGSLELAFGDGSRAIHGPSGWRVVLGLSTS